MAIKPDDPKNFRPYKLNLEDEFVVPSAEIIAGEPDMQMTQFYRERSAKSMDDMIGLFTPNNFSLFEKKYGIDITRQVILDDDQVLREYWVRKDMKTGQVVKEGLVNSIDAVKIEDVKSGISPDPRIEESTRRQFYKNLQNDIDPSTGELKSNLGKSFLEAALSNSNLVLLGALLNKVGGGNQMDFYKYGGLSDPTVNKLDFKEDGIYYDNIKLNLLPQDEKMLSDWFTKKTEYTHDSFHSGIFGKGGDSFLELMASIGLGFLIDAPLFMVGGKVASTVLGKIAPSLFRVGANMPMKFLQRTASNSIMLSVASAPSTIVHTQEGGVSALLDDIKHTAEFSVMAGGFGVLGDWAGTGVSKLLGKPQYLQLNQTADFLRKNPKITQTLTGGITSTMLGYTTAGGDTEDRLATAFTFAAMHFANGEAWQNYAKGNKKAIMVEKDNWDIIKAGLKKGISLDELYKTLSPTMPRYYEREGNKNYAIDENAFVTKGEIIRLNEEPIELTPELAKNYKYITEAVPFAKKTMAQAFREQKLVDIANRLDKTYFRDVINPFNKNNEKEKDLYENFDYNKRLSAHQLAYMIYVNKLFKQLKQNELPNDIQLKKFINTTAQAFQIHPRVFEQFIKDNVVPYVTNPKAWTEEKMKFLPEDYIKSFESGMREIDKALKRQYNAAMISEVERVGAEKANKLAQKRILEFDEVVKPVKEWSDVQKALEKGYPPDKIFEQLKQLGKMTTKEEFSDKIQEAGESARDKELTDNATKEIIKRQYGTEFADAFYELLSKEDINKIGTTGVITEDVKKALDELHTEYMKNLQDWKVTLISKEERKDIPTTESELDKIIKESGYEPIVGTVGSNKKGEGGIKYLLYEPVRSKDSINKEVIGYRALRKMGDTYDFKNPVFLTKSKGHEVYQDALLTKGFQKKRSELLQKLRTPEKSFATEADADLRAKFNTRLIDTFPLAGDEISREEARAFQEKGVSPRYAVDYMIETAPNKEIAEQWKKLDFWWDALEKMGVTFFRVNEVNIKDILERESLRGVQIGAKVIVNEKSHSFSNEVPIKSEQELMKTLVHEGIHVFLTGVKNLTIKQHQQGQFAKAYYDLKDRLNPFFDRIDRKVTEDINAGLLSETNARFLKHFLRESNREWSELITYPFSKPIIAAYLDTIPYEGMKRAKNNSILYKLLETTIDWVKERFGMEKSESKTALDELYDIFHTTFKEHGLIDEVGNFFPTEVNRAEIFNSERSQIALDKTGLGIESNILPKNIEPSQTNKNDLGADKNISITKSKDFEFSGNYDVKIGDKNFQIFRDPESKLWYEGGAEAISKGKKNFPLGSTKEETIQKLQSKLDTQNIENKIEPQQEDIIVKNKNNDFQETKTVPEIKLSANISKVPKDLSSPIEPSKDVENVDIFLNEIKKVEPTAKTRKVETEPKMVSMAEVERMRLEKEKTSVQQFKLRVDKKTDIPIIDLSHKGLDKVLSNQRLLDLGNKAKEYLKNLAPPVFKAEWSERFKNEVYKHGEELIRQAPYHFNTVMRRYDGWNSGMTWRTFAKIDHETKQPTNPDAISFLDAFKNYEYARYTKMLDKELTWNEFADWAKFNPEQRKQLDILRISQEAFIKKMIEIKRKHLLELDDDLYGYLTEKDIKDLFGKEAEEKVSRELLSTSLDKKIKAVDAILNRKYAGWGKYVYYNAVRPSSPETVIVEMSKPNAKFTTAEMEGQNEVGRERIYTYFDDMKQAEAFMNEKMNQGWSKDEAYRIKDLINRKDFWGKLNEHQLMELAIEGHIPLSNEVIQKLLEATKKGVDIHTINKDYVPGMKYSPAEYEQQLERLGREAIYGSMKSYYLTKINNNLRAWESELLNMEGKQFDPETTNPYRAELQKMKEEYNYSQRYYNQLRAPERTIIDKLRGFTIATQVGGVKPSFLFQQASQGLQTTLHLAYSILNQNGLGGFGDAATMFGNASVNSVKLGLALRAIEKGLPIDDIGVNPELVKHIQDLSLMGKIRAVGLGELMGEKGELRDVKDLVEGFGAEVDYYYNKNGAGKMYDGLIKWGNSLGAMMEKYTRIQAASTFYDVGKRMGLEGDKLTNFMADNIDKSMAEWGKGGRSPFLDSMGVNPNQGTLVNALKKSFMTYKTFSFYNYGLYEQLIRQRQWGALSSKMMVGLGMHGITAFPLMASMFAVAQLFSDEDIDYTMLKTADYLDEKMPFNIGTALKNGVGGWLGLDMRNTFDESTPIITDLISNTWAKSWEGKVIELSLGAPFGFTKDAVAGAAELKDSFIKMINSDEFITEAERESSLRRVRKLSPVFIRNVFLSMDYDKDGVKYDGKDIVKREDLTSYDLVMKAMSFPIDRINRGYLEYKFGEEAQINKLENMILEAKKFIKEVQINDWEGDLKRSEINRAKDAIKGYKEEIIQLKKQLKERNRK